MPEEFGLQQGVGKGRAIQLDKGPVPPAAAVVQGRGDQFFSGPPLAPDQHRPGDGGDLFDLFEEGLDVGTGTDDPVALSQLGPVEHIIAPQGLVFGFQAGVFPQHLEHALHLLHTQFQLILDVKILLDKIVGSVLHCLYGRVDAALAGQDDDRQIRPLLLDLLEDVDAIRLAGPEVQIEHHQLGPLCRFGQVLQEPGTTGKRHDLLAPLAQLFSQQIQHLRLVVGDQDTGFPIVLHGCTEFDNLER